MKAAALLEDNTEELADVVNTAGNWVKAAHGTNNSSVYDTAANHYYNVIEGRCGKTALGAKILAKHWFVDDEGSWSTEERTAYDAMHKALGDAKTE